MEMVADMGGTFHPQGLGDFDDAQFLCLVLDSRLAHAQYSGGVGVGLHGVEFTKDGNHVVVPLNLSHRIPP